MHERDLGRPLAHGRTAAIYAWEEGYVLKLFHDWFKLESIAYEAQVARAVHTAGLPIPAVGDIVQVNGANGLVYERVDGPTMLAALQNKPWRLFNYARRLAVLHAKMHTHDINPDIPPQRHRLTQKIEHAAVLTPPLRAAVLAALQTMPDGRQVCHGDFHPENVLLTAVGEVVIDWTDAMRGNPLADVARTSIILQGAIEGDEIPNRLHKIFMRLFHATYRRRYFTLNPGSQQAYKRWLPIVAAARLSENIPELEGWLIAQAQKLA